MRWKRQPTSFGVGEFGKIMNEAPKFQCVKF